MNECDIRVWARRPKGRIWPAFSRNVGVCSSEAHHRPRMAQHSFGNGYLVPWWGRRQRPIRGILAHMVASGVSSESFRLPCRCMALETISTSIGVGA